MIKTLNFVKGAVSTKDLVPVLANFHFYGGRVQGGNGRITIDAPLSLGDGMDITVPATAFLKAIAACDGAPILKITEGGRLSVRKGAFKSLLPLADGLTFPRKDVDITEGMLWKMDAGLIKALRTVRPFIGQDASRPWACGALFKDGYIYATNNVVMVRVPWDMPDDVCLNIPFFAIDELVRIGEEPAGFMFSDTDAVFHYGDRWLRSQLFDSKWPDVGAFFNDEVLEKVPEGLRAAVEKIVPFCPDSKFPVITLGGEGVTTADGTMTASVGDMELPDGKYRAEPLLAVLSHATEIDLTKYPSAVPFAGASGLQGVMIGVKT